MCQKYPKISTAQGNFTFSSFLGHVLCGRLRHHIQFIGNFSKSTSSKSKQNLLVFPSVIFPSYEHQAFLLVLYKNVNISIELWQNKTHEPRKTSDIVHWYIGSVWFWPTCLLLLRQLNPGSPSHWACSLIWRGTQGSGLNNENNMNLTLKAAKNGLLKEIGMKSNSKTSDGQIKQRNKRKEKEGRASNALLILYLLFICTQCHLKVHYK